MKKIAENVEIKVGEHTMKVEIIVNDKGNIEILFADTDLEKMPDGFCYEGFNNELIIYPFKH